MRSVRRKRIGLAAGGAIALMIAVTGVFWAFRREAAPPTVATPVVPAAAQAQTVPPDATAAKAAPAGVSTNTPAGVAPAPAAAPPPGLQRLDKDTVAASLKRWIKRKEGRDVDIVEAQGICDLDGKPASANVLVTANSGDALSPERLREQLAANAVREHAVREELAKAYRDGDVAAVNRLVAEITASRTAFVESTGVTSYKLSLNRTQPPVLAFWPGLPFETVKEEAARGLAVAKLGAEAQLQGLVHYTSATALLRFADGAGNTVLVDPFNMVEVPQEALQLRGAGGRPARADDAGRTERIAAQWTEFLQP